MKSGQGNWQRILAVMVVVVGVMMAGTIPVAQAANVIPRNENAYGNSYGEWSARWVQWLLSIPAATNPAADLTGAHCGEGQAGPVWFLAGTFGGSATRDCTVPAGKALFFPIVVTMWGAGVFDCEPTVPGVPCNLAALRGIAAASVDSVTLEASIDHKRLKDLTNQRVQAPAYTITYPADNVYGLPAGIYAPNVADGYWIMIPPLSAGKHSIHFKGEITGGVFAGFVVEVTYHLTIEP